MSARDDYPLIEKHWNDLDAVRRQAYDMIHEINRLRKANVFMREVLDDVLPTIALTNTTFLKVDGHWVRVTIESSAPSEPLRAKATVVT